jgi:hypothetical protein
MFYLAQVTLPTEGDDPWIWLCGALTLALIYVFHHYDANRNDTLKRERERNEILINAVPEIVTIMREWKAQVQSMRDKGPQP